MKQQPWLIFLKYPYSTIVLACVWVGSAVMVYIDRDLPILGIVVINIIVGWIITWLSFRSKDMK